MKNLKKNKDSKGFTLIEILVVIGIIAVLATIVLIAINPARQFAQARDSQRISNLNAILNSVGQRIADNQGVFAGTFDVGGTTYTCGPLPSTESAVVTTEATDTTTETGNLGCLVPTYIPSFPFDPTDSSDPDTGYNIYQDPIGRVHVIADAEETAITRILPIEVVR